MMMNMLDAYEESLEGEKASNSKRSSLAPGEPGENEDYTTDALGKNRNSVSSITSSVSGNVKSEKDLRLLHTENEAFKNATTNSESVKRLKTFMENTPEPFSKPFPEQSKWAGKPQGCCVLS